MTDRPDPVRPSPDDVFVRSATPDDAAVLATLGARTFRETYRSDVDPDALEEYVDAAFAPDRIATELADDAYTFLLATVDGGAVGYATLRAGETPTCVSGPHPVELVRLYLDRAVIGAGIGATLMAACLERARADGHETVWLGVWERNEHARRFYRRWGFREVGSRSFGFGEERHTDVVMSRRVTDASSGE